MKKIFIPAIIIILLQGVYILKLRHDLSVSKAINIQAIMQIFDKTFAYTEKEEYAPSYSELPEPNDFNDNSNIIERIDMLEMHLDYNPSRKWIRDVLNHAKKEIESY